MYLELDLINILVAATAVANIFYGLVVYSRNRKSATNITFFTLTLTVSAWGITMFLYRSAQSVDLAILFAKLLYIAAASIPMAFLYFVKTFPSNTSIAPLSKNWYLLVPYSVILLLSSSTFLIENVKIIPNAENFIVFNQTFHFLYALYIVTYFGSAYYLLIVRLIRSRGIERTQIIFIFLGTLIATSIGVFTNLLLPLVGNFSLNWLGQFGTVAMISFITYAILKHHLFSVQVIATEVFMVGIWIALFSRIFAAETFNDKVFTAVLFGLVVAAGTLLIRSVIREVEAKQHIEKLAGDLKKANVRLKEMDQLKSQFLSIASHDLRAPLTAIRNFMSILLEGTYGKLPAAAEEGTRQVYERATEMADMVDNYLNVSRIEQGRMKYDHADIDFKDTLNEAVDAFAPVAEEKGLTFNYTDITEPLPMKADEPKLREVIENLINNAINYTPKGSITVTAEKAASKVKIIIQDTGIGMSEKTIKNLFGLFAPGEDSRKYNPKSTGVGLYITKAHVEAHKGTVRAESDGEGKGSRFVIELPLK